MDTAQSIVHSVEQGKASRVIRVAVIGVGIVTVALIFLLARFRGFYHAEAMDQAQLSRQIANGRGFTTKFIRPLALWQLEKHTGAKVNLAKQEMPDTFNQPLPALLNVIPIRLSGNAMTFGAFVYVPAEERWLATFAMLLFLGAVVVQFFLVRRLFDQRLAFLVAGLMVICDLFWQFSLSGLPQMLMLLIFSGALYTVARAIEDNQAGALAVRWFAAAGGLFGLLALCHGLAFWPFLGLLIFAGIYFRPRGLSVSVMLVAFLVVVTPWLIRNYNVSGHIFGTAYYWIYDGVKGTASVIFRAAPPELNEVTPLWWRPKLQASLLAQAGSLFGLLGSSVVAPLYFVALLHPFKRRETAHLRWAVLAMWMLTMFGMALFAVQPGSSTVEPVASNQLHVLFTPIMIAFGLAFILMQASRLNFSTVPLLHAAFLTGLFILSGLPLLLSLLPSSVPPLRYPPYFPPLAAQLKVWVAEGEILVSDQPWAVAWYADRKALWLPAKMSDLVAMNDYTSLGIPVAGVFLSPVTGHSRLFADVLKGEYKDWVQVILRSPGPTFPFKEAVPLPPDGEFIFFSDRKRWEVAR